MKVYYFNDEQKPITVRIFDATYDPTFQTDNQRHYHKLEPAEGKMFDVELPEGTVPFIKKWVNMVMISYVDPAVFLPLQQPPQQDT